MLKTALSFLFALFVSASNAQTLGPPVSGCILALSSINCALPVSINGATIGSNALAVTGTGLFSGALNTTATGSATVPAMGFGAGSAYGWSTLSAGVMTAVVNGAQGPTLTSAVLRLTSTANLGWSASTSEQASDLILARDAANTLAQRNGTAAQLHRIYNTWANTGTDFERANHFWSANTYFITPTAGGTGTNRSINIYAQSGANLDLGGGGVAVMARFNGVGLIFPTDNTYDIGASGATRPRNLYVAGTGTFGGAISNGGSASITGANIVVNASGFMSFTGRSRFLSSADGQINARNAADDAYSFIRGKIQTDTNYTAGAITETGYITLYDATGTAYKVNACLASGC